MKDCPSWLKQMQCVTFLGSAAKGLGFYHVEVMKDESNNWLNMSNCGIVKVLAGELSIKELEVELADIFCKEWPWKVRMLQKDTFLVRFPPHKKVEDIKNIPSFNLRKEGVRVEVLQWDGEMEPVESLQEVWIQVRGIPPKHCNWSTFTQVASSIGILVEVDWTVMFKSFYEMVRFKIACRRPEKIPFEKLFELERKLYPESFELEGDIIQEGTENQGDDGDNDEQEDKNEENKEYEDLNMDDIDDLGPDDDKKEPDTDGNNSSKGAQGSVGKPSKGKGLMEDMMGQENMLVEEMSRNRQFQTPVNNLNQVDMVSGSGEIARKLENLFPSQDSGTSKYRLREEDDEMVREMDCSKILKLMELDTSEDEEEEVISEIMQKEPESLQKWGNTDEDSVTSADEQVKDGANEDEMLIEGEVAKQENIKQIKQSKYGPRLRIDRPKRNSKGEGKTALEKATELAKIKNLEIAKPSKAGHKLEKLTGGLWKNWEDAAGMEHSAQTRTETEDGRSGRGVSEIGSAAHETGVAASWKECNLGGLAKGWKQSRTVKPKLFKCGTI